MPRPKSSVENQRLRSGSATPGVSLKILAEHLGLSKAAVSLVINRSPSAKSIPRHTQERIRAAARELNYRPNFMARSLRRQRSFTVGVVVPEISEGYAALVLSGIEDHLLDEGYFYLVVSHRHRKDLLERYPLLAAATLSRGFDCSRHGMSLGLGRADRGGFRTPGHSRRHEHRSESFLCGELALEHLTKLGHSRIAFIKGQDFSSDTEVRWDAVLASAKKMGLEVNRSLTGQFGRGIVFTPNLAMK